MRRLGGGHPLSRWVERISRARSSFDNCHQQRSLAAGVDGWATLVDLGRDPGPTFIHHITADMLSGASTLADAAGEILSMLDGAVAVAHNARFEVGFIAQEFARVGISPAPAV